MQDRHEVKFVRLERVWSESYITFELPYIMPFDMVEFFLESTGFMPGWELIMGCMTNPDNDGDEDWAS